MTNGMDPGNMNEEVHLEEKSTPLTTAAMEMLLKRRAGCMPTRRTSVQANIKRRAHSGTPAITIHPLLTARDVARVLSVGERTVWRMTSRAKAGGGEFPEPVRIGGHAVRWRWQDVEKYLQELSMN